MSCIIMRGVPGSGKSYHAKKIMHAFLDKNPRGVTKIVGSDSYFTSENGEYKFRAELLGEAHTECFREALVFLQNWGIDEQSLLIVSNTNIHAWEVQPYVMLARALKHRVSTRLVMCDIKDALVRQTHNVPESKLIHMWRSMEPPPVGVPETVIRNFYDGQ